MSRGRGAFRSRPAASAFFFSVTGDKKLFGVKAQPGNERAFFKRVTTPAPFYRGEMNRLCVPVEFVADNRVSKGGKVHANLVDSAGFRNGLKNAEISGASQKAK